VLFIYGTTPPFAVIANGPVVFWAVKQSILNPLVSLGVYRSNLPLGVTVKRLLRAPEEHRRLAMTGGGEPQGDTVKGLRHCAYTRCARAFRNDRGRGAPG
jgi:hypothetical protein